MGKEHHSTRTVGQPWARGRPEPKQRRWPPKRSSKKLQENHYHKPQKLLLTKYLNILQSAEPITAESNSTIPQTFAKTLLYTLKKVGVHTTTSSFSVLILINSENVIHFGTGFLKLVRILMSITNDTRIFMEQGCALENSQGFS